MKKISIHTEYIKLSQLLKLADFVSQGADAKIMILEKKVKVNHEFVLERGKKIRPGDIVEVLGEGIIEVTDGEN